MKSKFCYFHILIVLIACRIVPSFQTNDRGPNIVFILIDDVGWADFGYNNKLATDYGGSVDSNGQIPTPNIDALAERGLKLTSHYVHPTCTPTRASLMTGRYASSTGMPFASLHGAVTGLPENLPTLPNLLRKAGYSAHMVGKWHLGHAQPKQGPTGRGFESFTGSYLWALDSYTKLVFGPKGPYGIDWVTEFENGTYEHKTEHKHATLAITDTAVQRMTEHKDKNEGDNPLFLYVSYNAAHSPCQSEPGWEESCVHIPHLWRRQYCGMVVGLDQAIREVTNRARDILGDNTVIVVSSDNGGSVWLGGMNAPFRSGKLSPFEGGVRVPSFALDMSKDGNYLGKGGRAYRNLIHISDWLPTFISWSNNTKLLDGFRMDGVDQSKVLKGTETIPVRDSILLDLYTKSHDGASMAAYRKHEYKLVHGYVRDPNWYNEPTEDKMNTSDTGVLVRVIENIVRLTDWIFGHVSNDLLRLWLSNIVLFQTYWKNDGFQTLLFDIEKDPQETVNIAEDHPDIVKDILRDIDSYTKEIPANAPYWMITKDWGNTFVPGNCSTQNEIEQMHGWCRFSHSWHSDSEDLLDLEKLDLVHGVEEGFKWVKQYYGFRLLLVLLTIVSLLTVIKIFKKQPRKTKQN